MICSHCNYKWFSSACENNKKYVPFCPKCYKKTGTSFNDNIFYRYTRKAKYGIKKQTNSVREYLIKKNFTVEHLKEKYIFHYKIIADILLFSFAITLLILIAFYFFIL